jgi:fatty-acid desaturase
MFTLKPLPPFDNVADLRKDPLVAWQHRYIHLIAVLVAFVLQASIGFVWGGWKAALYLFSAAKAQGPIFLLCTHFRSFQGDFRRIQVGP